MFQIDIFNMTWLANRRSARRGAWELIQVCLDMYAAAFAGRRNISIDDPVKKLVRLLQNRFNLTDKEAEIAARLIGNERQAEIIAQLNISPNTFKTHRKRIYEKMGAARQIDLVASGQVLRDLAARE